MKNKRYLCFLLTILLIFNLTAVSTYAQGSENEIETTYGSSGKYEVATQTIAGLYYDSLMVYYPKYMTGEKFPLVIWGNGTFTNPTKYSKILTHLASQGYIIVCSWGDNQGNGVKMVNSGQAMLNYNNYFYSPFYQKIDISKIAVIGHSQGACGAVNTAISSIYGTRVKTIVLLSLVSKTNLSYLGCSCDVSAISNKPTLLLCGDSEDDGFATIPITKEYFQRMSEKGVPVVMAALSNSGHNEITDEYGNPERYYGYLTAWLNWQLKGDELCRKAFTGDDAEIVKNSKWLNVNANGF